ncbi:D-alanine--D-alanine ligase [Nitrospina watsonii]|uniref:D-alanine--D-alanine ligase n=1 Tax=Nitrospina watsonii TaxID=1323948 RepID=A0ABN8VV60_9BACT|nr:D-alanine--D-alanine ligase [Nitrospina watsonii]CAI2717692.1 D-alanine--D-alanine ligase B [Nitrospina watsonii]
MQSLNDKTIGVLMGGLSQEREVSLTTGREVLNAIQRLGLKAVGIDADHDVMTKIKEASIDLAFVALHGTYGEDGTIQGLLEYAGIPYTGSGVLGSAVAYNKVTSKEIFMQNAIPTAPYQVLRQGERDAFQRQLELPVVVKPSDQGSSLGVTIVREAGEFEAALDLAFRYTEEVVIEQFIDGKLLAIGMHGEQPMPIVHIRPKSGFYDYESKYTQGKTEYLCPAALTMVERETCQQVATGTFKILKGRGFPRVDVILSDDGVPYVLEMNTVPGMTPTSLLPMAAKEAGLSFDDLVLEILKTAQRDYTD